jgi:hypothetical protein
VNGIEGFLCELSAVERVQPEPLCRRIEVLDETARLYLAAGQCEVSLGADRRVIAATPWSVSDLVDPGLRRLSVSGRCNRSALWAALLEDLGVHHSDMVSVCRARAPDRRPVRYHRIERSGQLALITVTDGRDCLTHTFDLDAGQLPVAISVEMADTLSPPMHRPTHWGTRPPGTGPVGSWLRRLVGGP